MTTLASIVQATASWCMLALMVAIGLSLLRVLRGPTPADRALATDLVTIIAAGALGALALAEEERAYLTVALVVALVSFLATVALALFVQHGGTPPAEPPKDMVRCANKEQPQADGRVPHG